MTGLMERERMLELIGSGMETENPRRVVIAKVKHSIADPCNMVATSHM